MEARWGPARTPSPSRALIPDVTSDRTVRADSRVSVRGRLVTAVAVECREGMHRLAILCGDPTKMAPRVCGVWSLSQDDGARRAPLQDGQTPRRVWDTEQWNWTLWEC